MIQTVNKTAEIDFHNRGPPKPQIGYECDTLKRSNIDQHCDPARRMSVSKDVARTIATDVATAKNDGFREMWWQLFGMLSCYLIHREIALNRAYTVVPNGWYKSPTVQQQIISSVDVDVLKTSNRFWTLHVETLQNWSTLWFRSKDVSFQRCCKNNFNDSVIAKRSFWTCGGSG